MAKRDQNTDTVPFQLRLPEDVVRYVRLESVKNDLKYNEFFIQMVSFCKKNGFIDWLKAE